MNCPLRFDRPLLVLASIAFLAGIVLHLGCSRLQEGGVPDRGPVLLEEVEMLEDPSRAMSIDDVVTRPPASFRPRRAPVNLGLTVSAVWFRLVVDGDGQAEPTQSVLSLGARFDQARAFALIEPRSSSAWQELPPTALARNAAVPVAFDLPAVNGTIVLLVRVITMDTLVLRPAVETTTYYAGRRNSDTLRRGAYYGLVVGAIIYNLFLAFWLRDRAYYLYVAFEAAFCFTIACIDHTVLAVFESLSAALEHGLVFRMMNVTGLTAVLFANEFLDLRDSRRVRTAVAVTVVAAAILLLLPERIGAKSLYASAYAFNIYGTVLVASMTAFAWRRGNANAGLFAVALGIVLVATTLWSITSLGIMTPSYDVLDSLRFGSAVEAMLLAMALARKMNRIKRAEADARTELAETRLHLSNMLKRQVSSLNTLVGGVAHEIGNPLNFAAGGAKDVVARLDEADEIASRVATHVPPTEATSLRLVVDAARRSAALTARGTDRIASIVKNLRTYVGAGPQDLEPADLDRCIGSTVALLETHLCEKKIETELDLAIESRVPCNPSEMSQVFMNLVLNAIHAMPEGGTLSIRSREEGDQIRIVVSDTGSGVPPSLRDAIFDPFFTTRAPNEGTGLGLAVSSEIVRRHGGTLVLLPPADRGASFAVIFPRPH